MATIGFQYKDGPLIVEALPTTGSNNFKAGDLVYRPGGLLSIAIAQHQYAVALKDDSAVAGTLIPVIILMPGTRFTAQATAATLQTHCGFSGPIVYTTGSQTVTTSTTDAGTYDWITDELDPRDGASTSAGGRVIGRFNVLTDEATYT